MNADTSKPAGPSRSINDVRAPIMLLYVAAFCGGRLGEVPLWILLGIAVPISVAISLYFERALIRQLMRWRIAGVLAGLGAAAALWVLAYGVLSTVAASSLEEVLGAEGDLPLIFERLVAIKGEMSRIHPVLMGLGGAVLLGVGEEVFWRGFVQTRMMILMPNLAAVPLTAALYGGFYGIMMGPLEGIAAGVCGLVFSSLMFGTRSLIPGMISHGLLWAVAMWLIPVV